MCVLVLCTVKPGLSRLVGTGLNGPRTIKSLDNRKYRYMCQEQNLITLRGVSEICLSKGAYQRQSEPSEMYCCSYMAQDTYRFVLWSKTSLHWSFIAWFKGKKFLRKHKIGLTNIYEKLGPGMQVQMINLEIRIVRHPRWFWTSCLLKRMT